MSGPSDPALGQRPGSRLRPLTVADLCLGADAVLRESIGPVWVAGELTGFKAHGSGHWYFQLKDQESAVVSCAMFRGKNARVRFEPKDGLAVLVLCTPGVYAAQGRFQLLVESMEPQGAGAAALALLQLKNRLAEEGLFDTERKRALPRVPHAIGIVSSRDGAALRDVLRVLRRRFAAVRVLFRAASVQGQSAAQEITAAIQALDGQGLDVLLIVRGGGAREDLAAFDDERVVRAIALSRTPTVAGIGHEIDVTLADLAADVRAATPSAAAEIVVRERDDLVARLRSDRARICGAIAHRLSSRRARLRLLSGSRGLGHVPVRVSRARLHVLHLAGRLEDVIRDDLARHARALALVGKRLDPASQARHLATRRRALAHAQARLAVAVRSSLERPRRALIGGAARLDALSPLAVLARGYAIAMRDGEIVRDASRIDIGDTVDVRVAQGSFSSTVRAVSAPVDRGRTKP